VKPTENENLRRPTTLKNDLIQRFEEMRDAQQLEIDCRR
jgi:hypothetical protein